MKYLKGKVIKNKRGWLNWGKKENRKLFNGLKIENTESMEYLQKLINLGMWC